MTRILNSKWHSLLHNKTLYKPPLKYENRQDAFLTGRHSSAEVNRRP